MYIRNPNSTQVPPSLPASLPGFMAVQTDLIICETRECPTQTDNLKLCKGVISKLTPLFRAKVQDGTIPEYSIRRIVADLLRTLLVYNSNYERDGYSLENEFWNSDEWLTLNRAMVADPLKLNENDPDGPAICPSSLYSAAGSNPVSDATDHGDKDWADLEYVAEPEVNRYTKEIAERYENRKWEKYPRSDRPEPAYAYPLWVTELRAEMAKEWVDGYFQIYVKGLETAGIPRTPRILRAILARAFCYLRSRIGWPM